MGALIKIIAGVGMSLMALKTESNLKILSKCETARGIVHDVHHHMKDGDYKFGLDIQKKYKHLLTKGNDKKRVGGKTNLTAGMRFIRLGT